jgi:hypothetical protein
VANESPYVAWKVTGFEAEPITYKVVATKCRPSASLTGTMPDRAFWQHIQRDASPNGSHRPVSILKDQKVPCIEQSNRFPGLSARDDTTTSEPLRRPQACEMTFSVRLSKLEREAPINYPAGKPRVAWAVCVPNVRADGTMLWSRERGR